MSVQKFSNNASTTLGSAIGTGATTITVATGTGAEFPAIGVGEWFSATLWAAGSSTGTPNEIVYVTARTGDTMTVVRGQEGTAAAAWGIGDTFANYPTAAFYNGIATGAEIQIQAGNQATDTGTASAGIITLSPVPISLASIALAPIRVLKTSAANTGAYTLNVNGFGAKPVLFNGAALAVGQLPASTIFEVAYDGTNFELLSAPARTVNANLAQMALTTVKANITGGTADPVDVSLTAFSTAIGASAAQVSAGTVTTALVTPKALRDSLAVTTGSDDISMPLPNGYTEKLGEVYYSSPVYGEPSVPITFDAPFPTACVNVVCTVFTDVVGYDTGTNLWVQEVRPLRTASGFTAQAQAGTSGQGFHGFSWRAVGH